MCSTSVGLAMRGAPLIYLLLSVSLVVLAIGARTSPAEAIHVLRRPRLLAPAMVTMFVVVPLAAMLLAARFSAEIRFALIAWAVSPAPPLIPLKAMRTGAERDYSVGLLVAAAVVAALALAS